MTSRFTTQSLQQVLYFPFQDPLWRSKLGILALMSLASILIIPLFLVCGYSYEIMRRVIVDRDEAPSLPEWDDLGTYFRNGVRMLGAGLIYAIPSAILVLPQFGVSLGIIFIDSIPRQYQDLLALAMPLSLCMMVVGMAVAYAMQILTVAAIGHMVAKDDFGAAFRVREWWPILRSNLGGYVLTFLMVMGASYIFAFAIQFLVATVILCLVVPFLFIAMYAYLGVISAVLYSHAYIDGVEKSATPLG